MNEKRERKAAIIKSATAVILIMTLVAGLVTATVIVGNYGRAEVEGSITAESLDQYIIRYSIETETAFLDAARIYFTKMFGIFLGPGEFFQASWLSRPLLTALQRARISADKVLAFAEYLKAADPTRVIVADTSDPKKVKISVLPDGVDFFGVISDIVKHTGITPDELGTFIYEHLLDSADPARQELLRELGKEKFITIFIDTAEIYSQIIMFAGKSDTTLAEGRMARELLYELGSRYRTILDDFGYQKLEQLFGIGGNIINIERLPEEFRDFPIIANINAISQAMQGLTGYYFSVLSALLMNFDTPAGTDLPVTDALVKYINESDNVYFVYGALKIIRAAKSAHLDASAEYGISDQQVIASISEIAARFRAAGDDDNSAYPVYITEEREFAEELFAAMYRLSDESKSLEEIKALSETEILRLKEDIQVFAEGMDKFKTGLDNVQSFILIAMLFGMLPQDAL